jgi:hypothetical protein
MIFSDPYPDPTFQTVSDPIPDPDRRVGESLFKFFKIFQHFKRLNQPFITNISANLKPKSERHEM